jgi:hypothetical protein
MSPALLYNLVHNEISAGTRFETHSLSRLLQALNQLA